MIQVSTDDTLFRCFCRPLPKWRIDYMAALWRSLQEGLREMTILLTCYHVGQCIFSGPTLDEERSETQVIKRKGKLSCAQFSLLNYTCMICRCINISMNFSSPSWILNVFLSVKYHMTDVGYI